MTKQAQAVVDESLLDPDQAGSEQQRLQLQQQMEADIRMQLAEFAKEMELLKKLHKKH